MILVAEKIPRRFIIQNRRKYDHLATLLAAHGMDTVYRPLLSTLERRQRDDVPPNAVDHRSEKERRLVVPWGRRSYDHGLNLFLPKSEYFDRRQTKRRQRSPTWL